MKLSVLNAQTDAFASFLRQPEADLHLYKYDLLAHFRQVWLGSSEAFAVRYAQSLASEVTRRWWSRTGYAPREAMRVLIAHHPDFAAEAFKDLFDESRELNGRLDRFVFYADELLRIYRAAHPDDALSDHHQDWSIIALYLAGRYPDRYTLYPGFDLFNAYLTTLEAAPCVIDDLERFFKVMRTTHGFLLRNDRLADALESTGRPYDHLLLAHEFVYYVTGRWDERAP